MTSCEELEKIGELIRTQDNRITDQPLFIVEKRVKDWGYDEAYSDEFSWVDQTEFDEADTAKAAQLEELDETGEELGSWGKVWFRERWQFVTACFTEQGCLDYIARDGHNLGVTRTYACGSYRNHEYQAVRKALMENLFNASIEIARLKATIDVLEAREIPDYEAGH